jgi:VanZ family protein
MVLYWVAAVLFGAGIELAQGWMSYGRSADTLDALANTGGAIIAIIGSRFLHKFLA